MSIIFDKLSAEHCAVFNSLSRTKENCTARIDQNGCTHLLLLRYDSTRELELCSEQVTNALFSMGERLYENRFIPLEGCGMSVKCVPLTVGTGSCVSLTLPPTPAKYGVFGMMAQGGNCVIYRPAPGSNITVTFTVIMEITYTITRFMKEKRSLFRKTKEPTPFWEVRITPNEYYTDGTIYYQLNGGTMKYPVSAEMMQYPFYIRSADPMEPTFSADTAAVIINKQ